MTFQVCLKIFTHCVSFWLFSRVLSFRVPGWTHGLTKADVSPFVCHWSSATKQTERVDWLPGTVDWVLKFGRHSSCGFLPRRASYVSVKLCVLWEAEKKKADLNAIQRFLICLVSKELAKYQTNEFYTLLANEVLANGTFFLWPHSTYSDPFYSPTIRQRAQLPWKWRLWDLSHPAAVVLSSKLSYGRTTCTLSKRWSNSAGFEILPWGLYYSFSKYSCLTLQ